MNSESLEIRQLTLVDSSLFEVALELLNETQGRGLFDQDYVESRVKDANSFVLGAFAQNQLIGIAVAQVIEDFNFYIPFHSTLPSKLAGRRVGSFATLCFDEKYRGRGLGQRMSQMRLNWLDEQGCEVVLGVSWVSGLPHTSDRVFQKMGFQKIKRVENFFYQSSLERPFHCPGCGGPPCSCPAELYLRCGDQGLFLAE